MQAIIEWVFDPEYAGNIIYSRLCGLTRKHACSLVAAQIIGMRINLCVYQCWFQIGFIITHCTKQTNTPALCWIHVCARSHDRQRADSGPTHTNIKMSCSRQKRRLISYLQIQINVRIRQIPNAARQLPLPHDCVDILAYLSGYIWFVKFTLVAKKMWIYCVNGSRLGRRTFGWTNRARNNAVDFVAGNTMNYDAGCHSDWHHATETTYLNVANIDTHCWLFFFLQEQHSDNIWFIV